MNYYEQVRDHVERLAECPTSDAQGIIEAWAMKEHPGRGIMADTWAVEVREAAGTDPEQLARTILNMPATPNSQEHTQGPWEASEGSSGTLGGKMERRIFIRTTFHAQGKITNGPEATIATIEPNAIGNSAVNIGGEPFEHRITPQEAEANARVMALAPKMLAELRALVKGNMGQPFAVTVPALDAARAIIAEATGK